MWPRKCTLQLQGALEAVTKLTPCHGLSCAVWQSSHPAMLLLQQPEVDAAELNVVVTASHPSAWLAGI